MWLSVSLGILVVVILFYILEKLFRKPRVQNVGTKSVFITGTDTGFGHQLALHLDSKGVKVYAGCYTEEGADILTKNASSRLKIIKLDVTKMDSILRAKKEIQESIQPGEVFWGLVNNAGIFRGVALYLSTIEDFKGAMDVNFFGVINVTDAFLPLLHKSGGRIVNIVGAGGHVSGGVEPYACSKFALRPYTDGLRRWFKMYGGHVATIDPGMCPYTEIARTLEFQRSMEIAVEKAPEHFKEYAEYSYMRVKELLANSYREPPLIIKWNRPILVTKAMNHALFAKYPKSRYYCGYDMHLIYRWAPLLPDWLMDIFVKIVYSYYFNI